MKKLLSLCYCTLAATFLQAQQFVSNTTQPKNILFEQLVGVSSDSTTLGQLQINSLTQERPSRFFCMNIHAGNKAVYEGNPAFQTQAGNDITTLLQSNNIYQRTAINRIPYSNSYWIVPDLWETRSASQLAFDAKVNIAPRCTLDVDTRSLKMHVQMYYTNNGTGATDRLHVAILQNNIIGLQVKAEKIPTQDLGNGNYIHNNILCHLLTPTTGEVITPIQRGSLIDKYYTYTIPNSFGNGTGTYGSFPAVLENLDFLAYVVDSLSTVEQVEKAQITYISAQNNRILLTEVVDVEAGTNYCGSNGKLRINFLNIGRNTVQNISGYYTLNNGTPITFSKTFSGIASQAEDEFMLTNIALEEGKNWTKIVINKVNGADISPLKTKIAQFKPVNIVGQATSGDIHIVYNVPPDKPIYTVKDLYTNTIVFQHQGVNAAYLETADFQFPLQSGHCYEVYISSPIEPNIFINQPGLELSIDNNIIIPISMTNFIYRNFSYRFTYNGYQAIGVTQADALTQDALAQDAKLYPNPSTGLLNLSLNLSQAQALQIEIFNLVGQSLQIPTFHQLAEGEHTLALAVEHLENGMYFLRISNEKEQMTLPFILSK